MNTATIHSNKIAVMTHVVRDDILREFLYIRVPNGWDDVKGLTDKVLTYDNRDFTFSGWDSDKNECYFVRVLGGVNNTATIR